MDYQAILNKIYPELADVIGQGKVADYIPALARVPGDQFGMALYTVDGQLASIGQADQLFSIQSVSKVFALTLAMRSRGQKLLQRVGVEPSGDPFNSLIQLERENGIPRNPFINAGALVVADSLCSDYSSPKTELLQLLKELTGENIYFDPVVAQSEKDTSYRNRAMANLMCSFGNIENRIDDVLDFYCHQCALSMNAIQLAKAFSYLANNGLSPIGAHQVITERESHRISALMLTCGTYDLAGDFAYTIGLPAKSGVGGAIVAIVPGKLTLCAWSPGLASSGNSVAAMQALRLFIEHTNLSLF